jgi:WD40 repeat protein
MLELALSPDGKLAMMPGENGNDIVVQNLETEQKITLDGHRKNINCIAFSQDGRFAISGDEGGEIRCWNVESGKNLNILIGHSDRVSSVAFHPDGLHLLSGSWDETIRVWDRGTGECLRILKGHAAKLRALSVSADGKWAASAALKSTTICIWDLASILGSTEVDKQAEHLVSDFKVIPTVECPTKLEWPGQVSCLAFSEKDNCLLSGDFQGQLCVWNNFRESFRVDNIDIKAFKAHKFRLDSLAVSPDGTIAVTGVNNDGSFQVWDMAAGASITSIGGPISGRSPAASPIAVSVALSADATKLLCGRSGVMLYFNLTRLPTQNLVTQR